MKLGKDVSESSFCFPDTPQMSKNYIPDLLRTMFVKVSVKDGKISS